MRIEAMGNSTMERKMEKMVSLKVIAGPVFFSLAFYLSWTLGRWFFCGAAI
jgi:hypothetical protein